MRDLVNSKGEPTLKCSLATLAPPRLIVSTIPASVVLRRVVMSNLMKLMILLKKIMNSMWVMSVCVKHKIKYGLVMYFLMKKIMILQHHLNIKFIR
jgi:hypothetical protein